MIVSTVYNTSIVPTSMIEVLSAQSIIEVLSPQSII